MNKPVVIENIQDLTLSLLGLTIPRNSQIFLSEPDHIHMKNDHPSDYEKYFSCLADILHKPNYLAKHPKKTSIEHIKIFKNDYVLVAVHVTGNNKLFAKTLFVMETRKVESYRRANALIKFEEPSN